MRFVNEGVPIKIRIGNLNDGCYWKTIKTGETIDLPESRGKKLGLITEGKINHKTVETKQIESYTADDSFLKELTKIKGIGPKTAKDIVVWGTKEKLIEAIELKAGLPFRDDIVKILEEKYGRE